MTAKRGNFVGVLNNRSSSNKGKSPFAQSIKKPIPIKNVASCSLIQRYGNLGLGNPGQHIVPAGSVLSHGTPVRQFLVNGNPNPQNMPNPPAWFAVGSRFSAHAGSRWGDAAIYLHNYTVLQNINLVAFDDFADLTQYLQNLGLPAPGFNGAAEAQLVANNNPGSHGYSLAQDLVRNELEIILFAPGLAHLALQFRSELQNQEDEPFYDDCDLDRKRKLVGGGHTIHKANMNDLADFTTTADDLGTRRARSQSF